MIRLLIFTFLAFLLSGCGLLGIHVKPSVEPVEGYDTTADCALEASVDYQQLTATVSLSVAYPKKCDTVTIYRQMATQTTPDNIQISELEQVNIRADETYSVDYQIYQSVLFSNDNFQPIFKATWKAVV